MRITFFALLLNCALRPSSSFTDTQNCLINQEKWVNCNHCRCLWAWATWSCTQNICSSSEMEGQPKECVHGTKKMVDCNKCECQFGKWVCDRKLCNANCSDGDVMAKECNSCLCIGGKYRCTEYPCLLLEGRVCHPGSKQLIDCNECYCNHNGNALLCTNMDCS